MRLSMLVFMVLPACTTTLFHSVDGEHVATPRPVESVAVMACAPIRPFRILGVFEAQASSILPILRQVEPLDEGIVAGFRREAARLGCDAIVAGDASCSEGCPNAAHDTTLRCADDKIEGYTMQCIVFASP